MSGPDNIIETRQTNRYETVLIPFVPPPVIEPAEVTPPFQTDPIETAFPSHLQSRSRVFSTKDWQLWVYGEQSKRTVNPFDTWQPVTGAGAGISYEVADGLSIGATAGASLYIFPKEDGVSSQTVPSVGICINCLLTRED